MNLSLRSGMMAVVACVSLASVRAGVVFKVRFDQKTRDQKATGRLVVFVVKDGGGVRGEPVDGPSFENPQPMYGIDVKDLAPGTAATVDDRATSFPEPPGKLAPGNYTAQARLDMFHLNSQWRREPGNMWSAPAKFTVEEGKGAKLSLVLDRVVHEEKQEVPGVEVVEIKSELLSKFHRREVLLRAGVVLPENFDPSRKYGAVYEIPGFGGDHTGAFSHARGTKAARAGSPGKALGANCFWIVLDPESANGHTLFADSANNGPCAEALVKELIPALEKRYGLEPRKEARIVRGHSSGGWSSLWLALTYPETFGACWSSSPDPVDFARFQRTDIYRDEGLYVGGDGKETPSFREGRAIRMTTRQENMMEEVLGPNNTSGQQWDSWLAVFGPRGADGNPAALYDPVTGKIDRVIAGEFRKYDINALLKDKSAEWGPIFKQRIRLAVGDKDSYFLNEAVALLKERVDSLSFFQLPEGSNGYVKIVPGDHGTVFMSKELREYPAQMVEWLKGKGMVR